MASRKFKPSSMPPQYSELAQVLAGDLPSDQKLATLQKEFHSALATNRKFEKQISDSEKRCVDLTTQRDSIQGQLTKAVVAKSTLESLCRELQKHSKAVSEDTRLKVTEEKLARKEVAAQFQSQIDEITSQMQEQNQRNLKLERDNGDMRSIIEQFDAREENIRRLFEKKEIEIKLSEARAAQFDILLQQQKETTNAERDIMMLQATEKHKIYEETIMKEVEMRNEIEFYSAKFQEVQETMCKSGEAFEMLKRELDKKDKIIKRLDNDRDRLIKKLESVESTRREQRERTSENKKELNRLTNKNITLEGLCRALQEERTQLKRKISSLENPDTISTPKDKADKIVSNGEIESLENGTLSKDEHDSNQIGTKDGHTETICLTTGTKDFHESGTNDEIGNGADQSTDSDTLSNTSSKESPVKLKLTPEGATPN
ncbi:Alpha-taxilin-like [Oopsacas minuta]|uniref:Alpha-taxilin-like n=1 Tax=Oopsacas minuta TaxID=111878 RepID=A0AAV7JKJ4_9METZ|nr:Alpha-taxilin-like [Oopsacas minuta]